MAHPVSQSMGVTPPPQDKIVTKSSENLVLLGHLTNHHNFYKIT